MLSTDDATIVITAYTATLAKLHRHMWRHTT